MADQGAPRYPAVVFTDAGAPPGCMNAHNEATGQTIQVPATMAGIQEGYRELNNPPKA